MNLSINYLADQFIFWNLKKIKEGYLELIDSRNKKHFFGNEKNFLRTKVKINDPAFSLRLLKAIAFFFSASLIFLLCVVSTFSILLFFSLCAFSIASASRL